MSTLPQRPEKYVQEDVVSNIRDMTLRSVKDFKYDKVYYGDPTNGGSVRKLDGKPLFVTPHMGLASIFVGRRHIFHKLSEMGYHKVNLGYDEWASVPDQPLSEVHVYVRNAPNLKPFTVEFDGYLHTIDCSELKNNIYRYPWMSDIDHEVLIAKIPEVKIDNVQKLHIRYHVRGIEGREPLDHVQEGAFQDLKNGVNPFSDKMVFHVTPEKYADGQLWKPRVPEYLDPYNPDETGFEDNTTPRICFSTSIEGALNGITVNLPRQNPSQFDKMYVYIPEKPWKEYKHKTNQQLVKEKLVYDANVTREVWIMEPVRMKLYGVIHVDQVSSVKRKSVVPTSKGQKDARNYFTYKWHWVVKPRVLEKAAPYNYSDDRVIDILCIDLKKFKYGLITDAGKLDLNATDADFDREWRFRAPVNIDEAGGGNCYDMVEYEAGYLEEYGVAAYKKYFMSCTKLNNKPLRTHTFLVVKMDGKYIYIEQAFKRVTVEWGHERKKSFDKLNDIFDYVAECMADAEGCSVNFGVWDYTDTNIPYGVSISEFQQIIYKKTKMMYDGTARPLEQKPIKEGYTMPSQDDELMNRLNVSGRIIQEAAGTHIEYGCAANDDTFPITVPNEPTMKQRIILDLLTVDIPHSLSDDVIAPYCKKKGFVKEAEDALVEVYEKYGYEGTTASDIINAFDHPSHGYLALYPPSKAVVTADDKAYMIFDSSCNNPSTHIRVDITLSDDGIINVQIVSPDKEPQVKLFKVNLDDMIRYINDSDKQRQFRKACHDKIESLIPKEIKQFLPGDGKKGYAEQFYEYTGSDKKLPKGFWLYDLDRVIESTMEYEFLQSKEFRSLDRHGDWDKKLELLSSVTLKYIVIGNDEYYYDNSIEYEITTGNVIQALSRFVDIPKDINEDFGELGSSWKDFVSKIKKAPSPYGTQSGKHGLRKKMKTNRLKTNGGLSRHIQESSKLVSMGCGLSETNNETMLEGVVMEKKPLSRFFQEESEESSITIADVELGDDDDTPDTEKEEKPTKEDDASAEKQEPEKDSDENDSDYDVSNVDLGKFGSDTSDVQNEYDPKEIEILMKLMASEADAMNEYMDGAKDTNVDVLRRLYADIANEERFHMEQLLYAKCQLTGEKYEPKDPEVKSEYEELLSMGMDEESAMHAAADKFLLRGASEPSEEDAEEIIEDIKITEMALQDLCAKVDNFMTVAESYSFSSDEMHDAIRVFTEDATTDIHRGNYEPNSGGIIGVLRSALRGILRLLGKLIRKFGNLLAWIHGKREKYKAMYERNGKSWSILFKDGIKFYLINPKAYDNHYIDESVDVYQSVIRKLTILCGKQVSDLTAIRLPKLSMHDAMNFVHDRVKVEEFKNIFEGIRVVEHVQLNKIKYSIDADSEKMLDAIFFGYSKMNKVNVGDAVRSNNVYNRMNQYNEQWIDLGEYLDKLLAAMKDVKSEQRNPSKFKEALDGIKVCIRCVKAYSHAVSSDIAELAKINKAMIDQTATWDAEDANK